jgi:hypothetical protein
MRDEKCKEGSDLLPVPLVMGENLVGAPKSLQDEHGLVVRLRR